MVGLPFAGSDAVHGLMMSLGIALGLVLFGYGMEVVQAFNGAGDTVTPVFVSLGCFWLFKLPLAYVLSHVFGMGPRGAFVAITVAYSAHAIVSGLLFRRGRWQTKTLVPNAP